MSTKRKESLYTVSFLEEKEEVSGHWHEAGGRDIGTLQEVLPQTAAWLNTKRSIERLCLIREERRGTKYVLVQR